MCLRVCCVFLLIMLLLSCNKYNAYKQDYRFKNESGVPDFSNLDYWAAHPWKWDPSDSVPAPLRSQVRDSTVDVFFLHPTTLTYKTGRKEQNAVIDDWFINAKTDYTTILYQASVFNQECRVFAPRYRQAHIRNFYTEDSARAIKAFEIAYSDIRKSFEYYLQYFNSGRPIIIAAHSQGSKLAERLLKEFFENTLLRNKLVVAYIAGWPVPKNYFSSLAMCVDSMETGCLCSWRTFRKGYNSNYIKTGNGMAHATNPLNWKTNEDYAPRLLNKGSVLTQFNKIYPHTTDAQVVDGILYVRKPKFPGALLYFSGNYHIGDINLFYLNIRENVQQRIRAYWKK